MLALDIGATDSALTLTGRVGADVSRLRQITRACGSYFSDGARTELLAPRQLPALVAAAKEFGIALRATQSACTLVEIAADRLAEEQSMLERLGASGTALYPFQADGVAWLSNLEAGILADEMGLGKTVQILCALPAELPPVVVICPASLKLNWYHECLKWRPDIWPRVADGRGAFRWPEPGQMLIANYEALPKNQDFPLPPPGLILVADEAQAVKNIHSQRTQAFMRLARLTRKRKGRVWLATGTPIMNKPPELWTLLRVLDLHRAAYGTQTNFAKLFGGEKDAFGYRYDGKDPRPEAQAPIAPYVLRRRREAVLTDLPPKLYRTHTVEPPSGELADRMDSIDVEAVADDLEADQTPTGHDPQLLSTTRKDLALHKYQECELLIKSYEESAEPLVLFSYHRAPVIEASNRPNWLSIYGDRTQLQRDDAVRNFQVLDSTTLGIACTIATAAYGLTLTRAAHALFIDQAFTPAQNLQAEDRIVRIGQKRNTLITQAVCDHPLDIRVHEILQKKATIIQKSLGPLESDGAPTPDRQNLSTELRQIARLMRGTNGA